MKESYGEGVANRTGLSGSPDTTTWTYDPARGWLTTKTYADGNGVSYTYNPNSTLDTRHWSRGITTIYSYDPVGRGVSPTNNE